MHCGDFESTASVVSVDAFESFKDGFGFPVVDCVDSGKVDFPAQCDEEWNFVDEEDVHG